MRTPDVRWARLHVVILAAGFSRRMGRPKALLRLRGQSLLRRTLRTAAACRPARLSAIVPTAHARYALEAQGLRAQLISNPDRASGMASSVRRAIRVARGARAVLLMPVDLPHLRQRDLERLIRLWAAHPRRVVANRIEAHGGTPLILPAHRFGAAVQLAGDTGLRALLAQWPPAEQRLLPMPSAQLDLDTPAQLRRARRRRA